MLRKLKNTSGYDVTVAVQGYNYDTDFITVKAGQTVWVKENEYKFFLTDEKDAKGFLVDNSTKVLAPAFELMETDVANTAKVLTATFTSAGAAEMNVAHGMTELNFDTVITNDFSDKYEVKAVDATNVTIARKTGVLAEDATVQFVIVK